MCYAFSNATVLNTLNASQVSSMRKLRRLALINQSLRKEVSLPDMKVPKLTARTFDCWNTSFTSVLGGARKPYWGFAGLPIKRGRNWKL